MSTIYHGCIPDTEDLRDYEGDHLLAASQPFDWKNGYDVEQELGFKLPVKDQNGSYSCVGQGASSLAYIINAFELLPVYGSMTKEKMDELSAKSVYSQISLGLGKGATLRDAVKLLCDYGINTEKEVPTLEDGKPPKEDWVFDKSWMSPKLNQTAKNLQGKEFRTLRAKDSIESMAQCIRDNKAVIIGVRGSNNGTWRSVFPQVGEQEWGHCLLAGGAKVIKGKRYIKVLNSWGENTGENGWQYLGEEWFKDGYMFNPWFYTDKTNSVLIKLLDRNGKPRNLPTYMFKAINYLIKLRGYTYA